MQRSYNRIVRCWRYDRYGATAAATASRHGNHHDYSQDHRSQQILPLGHRIQGYVLYHACANRVQGALRLSARLLRMRKETQVPCVADVGRWFPESPFCSRRRPSAAHACCSNPTRFDRSARRRSARRNADRREHSCDDQAETESHCQEWRPFADLRINDDLKKITVPCVTDCDRTLRPADTSDFLAISETSVRTGVTLANKTTDLKLRVQALIASLESPVNGRNEPPALAMLASVM